MKTPHTLDDGENIDSKIPEAGGGCDSLDPKSSEVKEEEEPICFFPSIFLLPHYNLCVKNLCLNPSNKVRLLCKDNPTKKHQPPFKNNLKLRNENRKVLS